MKKVLISTIQPVAGGVPVMLRFVLECLQQRQFDITIAYYEPYSVSPDLSVPLFKIPFVRPDTRDAEYLGYSCVGIGCWLPELEFTHYWATSHWRQLVDANDVHIVVSGSSLAALPFVQTQTPFLAWVASDWLGDRQHRVRQFPWFRRLIDRFFVSPVVKKLERRIIASNNLVALSEHTRKALNGLVSYHAVEDILSMPIDTEHFQPSVSSKDNIERYQIGFVGRFEDPRKHICLLFECVNQLRESIPNIELVLVGDQLSTSSQQLIDSLGIAQYITVVPHVDNTDLPEVLQQLQLFVLPSYQEGLCIAAIEAMSCAVPVVSTRCGGPESYIIDGENGLLCEHNSASLTKAILQLFSDDETRIRYACASREVIIQRFSKKAQTDKFLQLFDQLSVTD